MTLWICNNHGGNGTGIKCSEEGYTCDFIAMCDKALLRAPYKPTPIPPGWVKLAQFEAYGGYTVYAHPDDEDADGDYSRSI